MHERIVESVVAAIAKQKQISPEIISLESSLEELGVTSLDAITIVFDIEEEFDIEVPGGLLESLRSVQDIVDGMIELTSGS